MGFELGAASAEEFVAAGADYAAGAEVAGTAGGAAAASSAATDTAVDYSAQLEAAGSYIAKTAGQLLLGQLLGGLLRQKSVGGTPQSALVNSSSNIDPIPVLYGRRRIGGTRILTWVGGFNPANSILNVVMVWGEGQISAVTDVYLDGVSVGAGNFGALASVIHYFGADNQAADPQLIADVQNSAAWNGNCTLSGIAYSIVRLVYDRNTYPGGMPLITADVNGKLLYDPRTTITGFSSNPALAIRDYLTNGRYGRGVDPSMIDDQSFIDAANHCDESVSTPAGTQARYTCDGPVNVDSKPIDNLRALLSSCRGYLYYSGGKYKLKCEKADTPVSFTLNEDNILGAWSITGASKRTRFNRVRARFYDAAGYYQPSIFTQESPTYRTQDNGLVLETSLELPYTVNAYTAQQLAQIAMKRSRFGLQVSLTATVAATQLEIGDVVPVTHSTPGWVSKLFRVAQVELLNSDEVSLTLIEYDATAYNLDTLTAINPAATMNLPDPLTVAAPGAPAIVESLYQTSGSAGVKSRASISWMSSDDVFVANGGSYQVEYQLQGSAGWKIAALVQSTLTLVDVFDLAPGIYNFRVRAINTIGASATSPTTMKELVGLTAPPSDLQNFAVAGYSGQARFTWSKLSSNSDLDVLIGGRVLIRWSPLTGGASWDHGSLVNPDGYPGDTAIAFGPLMTGTYMAKAMDSSGNVSVNAASFVATEALVTGFTTIATVTESPTFTGARSNIAAVDGGIQLDGITLIDSMLTLMDSWGSIDSLGGVQGTGSYTFANTLDVGSKTPVRLFATFGSVAFDTDDLIDSRTNNIDDWGLIDGAVIEDVEVQLMVRTSDDNVSYSAYQALGFVADFNFRYFQFRMDFASGNATHNRIVTSLSVAAKH